MIVGAGEGFVFPSCSTLLAAWTPLKERSIAVSVVYSGGMIGSVIGSSCSGLLIEKYGWTSVFYVFGGVSVIWCIVFVRKFKMLSGNNNRTFSVILNSHLASFCRLSFVRTIQKRIRSSAKRRKTICNVSWAN